MKIIYIENVRIPTEKAYGIQIMKMCAAFSLQNIDLELILPTRKNKQFKNINPFNYYQVESNFKIKKIKCFDPIWLMKLPQGVYIKFQILFFIISLFFYLSFRKNKCQYIFYTRDEYLLLILQKFSKTVIWEAHTLPRNKKRYLKYWQRCYKIICISKGLKNELINLGIDGNKILIAPDGVDLKKFQVVNSKSEIRKKLNLPLDKKIIMYTGHLYDWKGVQVLADASEFLGSDLLIVFVGGTEDDVIKFKEKNKDKKNVLILGYKKPSEIPFYLKSADIAVLPNSREKDISSKFTSPLKMFEYLASGVPIIASDLPSIREILNGNNAVLFESDNVQDLVAKIKMVLNDKNLANQIADQGIKDVKNYSWKKRGERIIKFL